MAIINNIDALNTIYVCANCGQVIDPATDDARYVTDHDGVSLMLWCGECVEEHAVRCERCGRYVIDGELHDVIQSDGSVAEWCDDCVDEHATGCEHCGDIVASDAAQDVVIRDSWMAHRQVHEDWCPSCAENHAIACDDCGTLFAESEINRYYVYGWNQPHHLCMSCRDDYYTCYDCGDLVHGDDVEEGSDDEYYCPNCISVHRRSCNIQGYHHTGASTFTLDDGTKVPSWDLSSDDSYRLYLGLELEIDGVDDRNDLADAIMGDYTTSEIELKEDGSLDYGFEIVSQPMTPMWHLTSGMWEGITDTCREYGAKSHDACTCGLHIHMSRYFFKNHDAVYRLDRLFHRFQRQLIRFSRRTDYQLRWCGFSDDSELAEIEDVAKRKEVWADKKRYAGRYEAINDTNCSTVEVRLWRGTLNIETLRATIELTTGLAIVANSMSDELAETLTWNMLKLLIRFALEQNGLPRDDLDNYLVRRGL